MQFSALLFTSLLGISSTAVLAKANSFNQRTPRARDHQQVPIMNSPGVALPPEDNNDSGLDEPRGDLLISDIIGKERSINIFAGFIRSIETISGRLDDSSQNTTVLAPLNSEVEKLPKKPWEDDREYAALGSGAYMGQDGTQRAHENLRRFVEAHVVPVSPWKEGDKVHTVGGDVVWWEKKGGERFIHPGGIEVSSMADRASNGDVWIIKGVLNRS